MAFVDLIYAVNGPDAYRKLIVEGFILDSATGKLLRTWSSPRRFSQPHDIAISKDGACLYVCDIGLNILHKFNLDDKGKELITKGYCCRLPSKFA